MEGNTIVLSKKIIFSAWPYGNGVLHVGRIMGSILPADIYHRYDGNRFYSGTDMHGTPIVSKAEKQGISPLKYGLYHHHIFLKTFKFLNIEFTKYTHTHTKQHIDFVTGISTQLLEQNRIYWAKQDLLFCQNCKKYISGRNIEGICKKCHQLVNDDICNNCGIILKPYNVKDPKCHKCKTGLIVTTTKNLFLRIKQLKSRILKYLKKILKPSNYNKIKVDDFFQDIPILRHMNWGIPFNKRVFYVWYEALLGYLYFFKNRQNVKTYYFMGQDNLYYHCIVYIALLIHLEKPLPTKIFIRKFLNIKNKKMSSRTKTGIDPLELNVNCDALRWYLSRIDTLDKQRSFLKLELLEKNNNELCNIIGNFFSRIRGFFKNFSDNQLKQPDCYLQYRQNMDDTNFIAATKIILKYCKMANHYITNQKIWIKSTRQNLVKIYNYTYYILEMLRPFTPVFYNSFVIKGYQIVFPKFFFEKYKYNISKEKQNKY